MAIQFSFGQVSADFTVNNSVGCAPFVVEFSDLSTGGGTSWLWDFGNGTTSTDQNPTFVFSKPGFYSVTLTTSSGGDSDTETKNGLIRVNASPIPNFQVNNNKGCSPHLGIFTDLSIPQSGTITQWYWAFGNGEISTDQSPSTTFKEVKDYDVYLKVTDINGCEATVTKNSYITLDGPEAKFVNDSVICGLPANVLFLNQSKGNNLEYYWEFGDGSTSTNEIPGIHSYTSFDSTEVLLAVTEKATGCSDTVRSSLIVGNYEATFDYNIICGVDEFTIEVENTTSNYFQLEWDFDGESYKFTDKASHHFTTNNEKSIILKATIDESCWDTTELIYTLPSPKFNYYAPKCSDPFEVTFENLSKGDNLTYLWDFNDSTYSTDFNPIHEFDVPPESYYVKLVSRDQFGCVDSIGKNVIVPFPIARFYEIDSIYTGCSPLNLTFKDTSYTLSSSISSVKWDFGDPASGALNTSTQFSPSHQYNIPGDYDITYIIYTDDGCADTAIYSKIIKAGEKPISADFIQLDNDTICYGDAITFEESATYLTPTIQSNYFCWSYYDDMNGILVDEEKSPKNCPEKIQVNRRDNDFVNFSNPKHVYTDFTTQADTINDTLYTSGVFADAGLLNTHLIIGYNNCFIEVVKQNFIDTTIASIGIAVKDSLIMFRDTTETFGFFNNSINYDSIAYGYAYTTSSSDTLFKFTQSDTNFVELKEGNIYYLKSKVINSNSGCENTINDKIVIDSVRLNFEMVQQQCLSDGEVLFVDNSYSKFGNLSSLKWLVNGQVIKSGNHYDSVYYSFPDTGVFVVTLERKHSILYRQNNENIYGFYTKSISKNIKIEGAKARGFSDTLKICGGDTIFFTDNSVSTTEVEDFRWRFGDDSDSSVVQNPFHVYYEAGTYIPNLYVTDTFGCFDSIPLPKIEVNKPLVNFLVSDSLICKHDVISLQNLSQGSSLSFNWTIDTITQFSIDIVHKFDSIGDFDVKLKATDLFGCSDSLIKTDRVKVEAFPETMFGGSPLYIDCPPLNSTFTDNTITPVTKWAWDFGDGKTSNDQNPTHIFTTPGLYDIQLITTNYAGCSDTLIKSEFVEINGPFGSVNFGPDTLCIPEEVKFEHEFTNTVFFIWNFGDGITESFNYSSNPDSIKHNYLIGGTFQPTIELIDADGCFYALPQQPVILGDSIDARFETTGSTICDVANIPFINTSRQTFTNTSLWDFGNKDTTHQTSPIYSYINDSSYTVKLIQTSPIGCVDSVSKTLIVFNAPYPQLIVNNDNYCVPSTSDLIINFDNQNFSPDSSYFYINNQKYLSDSVQKVFTNKGQHDVRMIIKYGSGACEVDSLIELSYYDWPVANYTYTPSNNSMEEPVIYFKNTSTNSQYWNWDFDDFDQSTAKDVGHNFNNAGIFNVQLIASNDGGCSDTIIQKITMSPYNFVKLSSAFSPNGDGQNETFGILRAGELTVNTFKIFNRWGNVVFETNDSNEAWDGKRKGKDQDVGTYIYYINGTKKNGESVEIKGNFTLLR